MCTVGCMADTEKSDNLPVATPPTSVTDLAMVSSDDEARTALAAIAPVDPAVRKRIFSALLRAISMGDN